jgi:L-alanine-DL-glutamate epimerase-like enolase superfamily enzyme
MKISKIDVTPVSMPMRLFTDAYSGYDKGEFALVKIETDEGIVGYGEAPSSVIVGFYGETLETVTLSLRNILAPKLIGEDPLNIRKLTSILDIAQGNSFIAKTGVDLALHDLIGKILKVPVSTVLGGKQRERIKACSEIGIVRSDQMAAEAMRLVEMGFRVIKIKAGSNPEDEMKGVAKVRDAVGDDIELRVDPNAGWSREDTMKATKTLLKCNVRYLEQPLPGWDLEGLAWVRKSTGMQIMVDESVWIPQDVARVAQARAADFVNIKITKTCGLKKAIEVYDTATAHGLPCVIGTELESCMGLPAKLHIAAALEKLPLACEFTEVAFQKVALSGTVKLDSDGYISVPQGHGLGYTPDLNLIEQHISK